METVDDNPIAVFGSASSLKVPAALRVYEDAVEVTQFGLGGQNTRSMRYDQIAQVIVRKSMFRATLVIESSGGHTMLVESMTKQDAEDACALIRERAEYAVSSSTGSASGSASDVPAQIRELAQLMEEGIITKEEFDTKKKDLLDRL
jgi:hypothetical protein